ncbi:hypothetical protein HGRIS_006035 [Hohenbuehelia grisea]|uniref:Uncharacterized protein n=1 Tax=Hohenbuehelia grisea TaxID=104357 RepID=A0ABR3K175_9AGAR
MSVADGNRLSGSGPLGAAEHMVTVGISERWKKGGTVVATCVRGDLDELGMDRGFQTNWCFGDATASVWPWSMDSAAAAYATPVAPALLCQVCCRAFAIGP